MDTNPTLSVAERIHQLERQSRSVPNLTQQQQQQQQQHRGSHGAMDAKNAPMHRSRPNLTLANGGQSINVDAKDATAPISPTKDSESSSSSSSSVSSNSSSSSSSSSSTGYTFLDPDKRMRVADPTLKAIQKQALLSYYERHAGRSSASVASSPPPPPPPPPPSQRGLSSCSSSCSSSSSSDTSAATVNRSNQLKVTHSLAPPSTSIEFNRFLTAQETAIAASQRRCHTSQ